MQSSHVRVPSEIVMASGGTEAYGFGDFCKHCQELNRENEELRSELMALRETDAELRVKNEDLNSQLKALKDICEHQKQDIDTKAETIKKQEEEIQKSSDSALMKRNNALYQQLQRAKDENPKFALTEKLDKKQIELNELTDTQKTLKERVKYHETEEAGLRVNLEKSGAQLQQALKDKDNALKQNTALQTQIQTQNETIKNLEQSLSTLQPQKRAKK